MSPRSNRVRRLSGIGHLPICRNRFRVCWQMLLSSALKSEERSPEPALVGSDAGRDLVLFIRLLILFFNTSLKLKVSQYPQP